jgi:hypothetical protein
MAESERDSHDLIYHGSRYESFVIIETGPTIHFGGSCRQEINLKVEPPATQVAHRSQRGREDPYSIHQRPVPARQEGLFKGEDITHSAGRADQAGTGAVLSVDNIFPPGVLENGGWPSVKADIGWCFGVITVLTTPGDRPARLCGGSLSDRWADDAASLTHGERKLEIPSSLDPEVCFWMNRA